MTVSISYRAKAGLGVLFQDLSSILWAQLRVGVIPWPSSERRISYARQYRRRKGRRGPPEEGGQGDEVCLNRRFYKVQLSFRIENDEAGDTLDGVQRRS